MSQVILRYGTMTAPEQLGEWVTAHPVQVRRYGYFEDLACSLGEPAGEWTKATVVNPLKEVREFVRLMLADFAELLGND